MFFKDLVEHVIDKVLDYSYSKWEITGLFLGPVFALLLIVPLLALVIWFIYT